MEKEPIHSKEEILLEEMLPGEEAWEDSFFSARAKGAEVPGLIKDLLEKANVFKISVWHQDHCLVTIPAMYGGAMAALFPFLSVFSIISLLALDCRIVVHKKTPVH